MPTLNERNLHNARPKRSLLPIAIGFLVRMAIIPFANLSKPMLWEYGDIARFMLRGYGYAFHLPVPGIVSSPYPTAIMPPGETLIHFASLGVFGDNIYGYVGIVVVHALCGIGFIYFSGEIVWKIFRNSRMKWIALWIAALYPSFVYATITFGLASVVLFLNALFIWSAISFAQSLRAGKERMKYATGFGLTAGLLGFFRSESPLLVVLTLSLILYLNRNFLHGSFSSIAVALLLYAAILAPWTIRNYSVFHKVIVGSSSGAFNLWRGNSEMASGSSWDAEGNEIATSDSMWHEIVPDGKVDSTLEQHSLDFHFQSAVKWMKQNPGSAALLDLKKVVLLWGLDWYSKLERTWEYILLYVLTLIVSILGLLRLKGNRSTLQGIDPQGLYIVALWCAMYTIITMIFFALPRFQIFLVALYLPIFALGMDSVLAKIFHWKGETMHR